MTGTAPPPYIAGLESDKAETVFRAAAPTAEPWEALALFDREREHIVRESERLIEAEWAKACERYAAYRRADERSAREWILTEAGDHAAEWRAERARWETNCAKPV